MQEGAVLEMRGICKYFPGVRALQDVDFTLRRGEIHALMGENGAGKSTLIKVLTGVYPKDGGEVHIEGVNGPAVIRSPQDAQNAGISTVYQEITLCPNLSVAENMYIGRTKGAVTNWRKMNSGAGKILESLGIPASPTQQLGTCSIAVQQMVAIARAVDMECKVLILDEPTGGLDPGERVRFRNLLSEFAHDRIVLISTHIVPDVEYIATCHAIIKGGKLLATGTTEELVKLVEGKVWSCTIPAELVPEYESKLQITNLRNENDGSVSIRYLSDRPCNAVSSAVTPRLEDLYLWMFPESSGESDRRYQ